MKRSVVRMFAILTVLAFAVPMMPQLTMAKDSESVVKSSLTLLNPATLAGKQLNSGDYDVVVDGAKITFKHNGKVVAEAPVQWKDSSSKANSSSVVVASNVISEVHFRGKTRYVEIAQ